MNEKHAFYAWLDHEKIGELVHRPNEFAEGERIVLLKGLVPGPGGFEELLGELHEKAAALAGLRRRCRRGTSPSSKA